MKTDKQKILAITQLTENEIIGFVFKNKPKTILLDIFDMVENKYKVPALFWQHINNPEWQIFIQELTTPLQMQMLKSCPIPRRVLLGINTKTHRKIDATALFNWWFEYRSAEVSESDTIDLYKIAQQKMNTELRQIIHAFQINVCKKTVETGRCTYIDAQNDFPDEIYRLALNDMAYSKLRPMSFKRCYFAGKAYIEKYLPHAILENNKTRTDI